ncbi:MAG: S9 family peptidase [Deltaproteobacteria bacterium]|nr:S9 family peptidase [Deltaproteobacteria bacterium]
MAVLAIVACGHARIARYEEPDPTPGDLFPGDVWGDTRGVKTSDTVDTLHGVTVRDPYRWLEDETDPDVQRWMSDEDAQARRVLDRLPGRGDLAARLEKLFYYDALGAPSHHKGRFFLTRKHAERERHVVYWKQGDAGVEKVLFDPNTWGDETSLAGWWPSHDGKHVAYNVSEHNSDETTLRVIDPATGATLPDAIAGTKYAAASWAPDGSGFYYTWVPPVSPAVTVEERPGFAELRFHKLGTDPALDPIVHPATRNPQTFLGGGISYDGHWLIAQVRHGWTSADVYFKDARQPSAPWRPLVVGVDALFDVDVWRGRFFVTTNWDAPRYRTFKVDPAHPERAAWREIIPETDATLQGVSVVGEHLVATYLRRAASEVEVRDLDGALVRKVALPPLGTSGGIGGNPDEDTGYFAYSSFTSPQVIYRTSIRSGATSVWTKIELPIDTSEMVTEQVFYPSKDGTQVSMFLVRKRSAVRDGKNPTILYGYGGFNVSQTPAFAASRALWIERGGIYAIPNLRGGGEYGEAWHRAGMLLDKQNVFDDFIAAGEYLVKEGWTSRDHLAISGGSNGGLLVGAALTQRSDLWKAVICAVPLLDMLRYHRFGSGRTWVPEYGSADDAAQFRALHAYSPYRRAVEAGSHRYPAILFDSADHDDRVDPMHARKMAAVLQANQLGDAPILLRIERNAGHTGGDKVRQQLERVVDHLSFLESQLR